MNARHARLGALLGSAALTWWAGAAQAQTQAAPQAANSTTSTVAELIVTAQKRAERLQDVPISISVVSGKVIEQAGVNSVADLQQFTPGLRVTNVNNGLVSATYLRGSGTNQLTAGADPSIAYFIDEVYQGAKSGLQFDLLDIDHVEVLKGPQGTLFGRNAAGGAISVTTRKPSTAFEGGLDARVGDYNSYLAKGSVSGPIDADGSWLYRLTAGYRSRDGFTKNLLTGKDIDSGDVFSARGELEYVGKDVTFLLTVGGTRARNGPAAQFLSTADATGVLSPAFAHLPRPGESFYKHSADVQGAQNQDTDNITGRLDWKTPIGTVTSITAYAHNKFYLLQDNDGTGFPSLALLYHAKDNDFSQELRLASDSPGPLSWIVGAYYYHGANNEQYQLNFGTAFPSPVLANKQAADNGDIRTSSYAAFGQATYNVTSQLSLTVGGRYSEDKKSDARFINIQGFPIPGFYPVVVHPSAKWNAFTPSATIDYKFNSAVMAYASYREGYKSGGFQTLLAPNPQTPFNPEKVKSYELGLKTTWLDNALVIDAALFRSDITSQQVVRVLSPALTTIDNAGATRDDGLDLSIAWRPLPRTNLTADMTFQDAKFRSYLNPAGANYTGHHQLQSPDFAGAYAAEQAFDLPNQGTLTLRGEYNYISRVFFDAGNSVIPGQFQPGYGLANARLTYAPPSHRWSLSLWVNNLSDQKYFEAVSISPSAAGGTGLAIAGQPRTFGVAAHVGF